MAGRVLIFHSLNLNLQVSSYLLTSLFDFLQLSLLGEQGSLVAADNSL